MAHEVSSVNLRPHLGRCVRSLTTLVLLYAALAGLRTVTDPDTGWQLATGKWILAHHQIPSADLFSYTAQGHTWIYPPFSELFLYGLFFVGGFAALSWLNVLACAETVGIDFEPPDVKVKVEARIAEGRARAWANLGDLSRAVGSQQEAVQLAPSDPRLWTVLADLYAAEGRASLEQEARQNAHALRRSQP